MPKNLESYRSEFPVTEKYVYLDHSGVAPASLRVKHAIERFLSESAEGGAFHYPAWTQRMAEIRRTCARLVNADPSEIAFVKLRHFVLSYKDLAAKLLELERKVGAHDDSIRHWCQRSGN